MVTRRDFLATGPIMVGASPWLASCDRGAHNEDYETAVARTWRLGSLQGFDRSTLPLELVRHATLAPSSHNTQCWKFRLAADAIEILPDLMRRCPAVDPDDHHLFVSLGCATENLVQAALAHGLKGLAAFDAAATVVRISLEPTQAHASPLFKAIAERQCTRAEYDGRALSKEELALLQQAGAGPGVRVLMLTERPALEQVLDYVVQGNSAQMNDAAFVAELKAWIRFSGSDAVRFGDGLYSAASGNPSVPAWLGSRMFGLFFTPKGENDKYARQVRSSAGIAVFVADVADHAHWVEVGRCYERFALQATAMGVRNAFLKQPVEMAALRPQFASYLGLAGQRPDLVVRFGRGPRLPASLRRPLKAVIV